MYCNIVFGIIVIIGGQAIATTGMFGQVHSFPAFRWAGWLVSLSGVVFLAYGIYGLLSRNRKDHNSKDDPDHNDKSE